MLHLERYLNRLPRSDIAQQDPSCRIGSGYAAAADRNASGDELRARLQHIRQYGIVDCIRACAGNRNRKAVRIADEDKIVVRSFDHGKRKPDDFDGCGGTQRTGIWNVFNGQSTQKHN